MENGKEEGGGRSYISLLESELIESNKKGTARAKCRKNETNLGTSASEHPRRPIETQHSRFMPFAAATELERIDAGQLSQRGGADQAAGDHGTGAWM